MLRKSEPVPVMLAAMLLLHGCGLFREKPPEYLASEEGVPLEIPEDLDAPRLVSPVLIQVDRMRMPSGDELNPGPPRAVSTGGGGDANAFIAWSAEGVYLKVKDSPDSVARRLGFAIERSGMSLLERAPDGSHRFEYVHLRTDDRGFFRKLLFWRDDEGPNHSGTYQTRLEADGDQTRVYLLYGTGGTADTRSAEHVLGIFMERLG